MRAARADPVIEALEASAPGRKRHALEALWAVFLRVEPVLGRGPAARRNLAARIEQLVEAGALTVPRAAKRWDRSAEPPLPRFVTLAGASPRPAPTTRPTLWAPELADFADQAPRSLRADLDALQRWLATGGRDSLVVPERERSLEVFGDEKRLEALRGGSLFAPGRLTLDTLRCFAVSPPLVWRSFAGAPVGLIVENHHSWHSFCRFSAATGAYAAVVYGAGKALLKALPTLAEVAEAAGVERFVYLGDVDPDGLHIGRRATEDAAALNLPPIAPAAGWYRRLFALADGRTFASRASRTVNPDDIAWLPAGLQSRAADLIRAGRRLPQELLGWTELAALDGPPCD
ncbi:MAG: hypothetical protein KC583_11625 [Myxococcales bacterium]|nr:hypothetical protein [Myxococcales bacterium]